MGLRITQLFYMEQKVLCIFKLILLILLSLKEKMENEFYTRWIKYRQMKHKLNLVS